MPQQIRDDTVVVFSESVQEMICHKCGSELDVSGLDRMATFECPCCAAELTVPCMLENFLLVRQLGRGGMATVYEGLDESLGRRVAIKVMRREFGNDPKFVEKFIQEARSAAQISCANVVQIYSVGQRNGQPFIVMELVNGGKFDEMIKKGHKLTEARILEIGIDVANGLKAAKEIGLIHGDVKPENVLFDGTGTGKVADFGLAQFARKKRKLKPGEIWGTPYYIAPEKAKQQGEDYRSDIYSLGATVFHALVGHPPFEGETAAEVVLARLKEPAPSVLDEKPYLHECTAEIVARMLEADPFHRYPNYQSLLADLRDAAAHIRADQSETRVGSRTSTGSRTTIGGRAIKPKGGNTHGMIIGITLTAIAVFTAAVIYLAMTQNNKPIAINSPSTTINSNFVFTTTLAAGQRPCIMVFEGEEQKALINKCLKKWYEDSEAKKVAHDLQVLEAFNNNLKEFEKSVTKQSQILWVKTLRIIPLMLSRKTQDVDRLLREILDTPVTGAANPGNMCKKIAQGLLDNQEIQVDVVKENLPDWFEHICYFYNAINPLLNGDVKKAEAFFKMNFDKSHPGDEYKDEIPYWPYWLCNISAKLKISIKNLESVTAYVDTKIQAGQYAEAIRKINGIKSKSPPLFRTFLDAEINRIQTARSGGS